MSQMVLSRLAANLKNFRERAGMTQKDLAEKAGVSQAAVARWEDDTRSPASKSLMRIAAALGVTADSFFGEAQQTAKAKRGRPRKDQPLAREVGGGEETPDMAKKRGKRKV